MEEIPVVVRTSLLEETAELLLQKAWNLDEDCDYGRSGEENIGIQIKICIRAAHHLFTMTTMLGFQIITIPGTLATEQRNKKAQDNSLLLLWLSRHGRCFKVHKKEREFSGVSGIDEEFTP